MFKTKDIEEPTVNEVFPVRELVDDALAIAKSPFRERAEGKRVSNHIPRNLEIKGNRAGMYIIFFNLLQNSIKEVDAKTIDVRYRDAARFHEFRIRDDGPGFGEGDIRRAARRHGRGIKIARKFARESGGDIVYETPSRGQRGAWALVTISKHSTHI